MTPELQKMLPSPVRQSHIFAEKMVPGGHGISTGPLGVSQIYLSLEEPGLLSQLGRGAWDVEGLIVVVASAGTPGVTHSNPVRLEVIASRHWSDLPSMHWGIYVKRLDFVWKQILVLTFFIQPTLITLFILCCNCECSSLFSSAQEK